jgi:ATP-dependent helicase/nuclease subunit B
VSGFLDGPPGEETGGPRWFNIPAQRPFLADLARGLLQGLAPRGPGALAEAVVLLPTRRAARDLAQAFLAASGGAAMLLPQVRALGDLDEGEPPFEAGDLVLDLPPAISPAHRRLELAGLVAAHGELLERRLDARSALELADALAAFLDAWQIEERDDPDAVDALVEGDLARHWLISAAFLKIATRAWPRRLDELGMMDVAARRVVLTRRLAERWRNRPPDHVMVAAGSTGSAPATADLLAAIAAAPLGAVVLPGLDADLAQSAWREVGEAHPQGTMKRLLERAGLDRGAVRTWPASAVVDAAGRWRRRLINEALRPPDATADWLAQIAALRAEAGQRAPAAAASDPIAQGLAGLTVITARTEEEAASAVALLLRETLETPGATAALVTPDDDLSRRVRARLTRWNIEADSSSGRPLSGAPAAVLAALLAHATAEPDEGPDPVRLLAILKHPLARLGLAPSDLETARRALERHGLRGPRPDGWAALTARLQTALDRSRTEAEPPAPRIGGLQAAIALAERARGVLAGVAGPWADDVAAPAAAALALTRGLEALASGPAGGLGELWAGQAGEALGVVLAGLMEDGDVLPPVTRAGFADLLDGLLSRERVRPGGASHPRLRSLGVLEARMLRPDRLILAGLEEGVWPQAPPIDPFLSRPMRERLGLPPPERRIGLSAHDFAQAACAPEVVLVSCERRGGSPAVASRWLWRLRALAAGAGLELPGRPEVLEWARALDAPLADPPPSLRTALRPAPTPPVAARPRRLSVTAVERWVRDPYALYAREILRLRPLDRPDEPVEARARGIAIHAAFERFSHEHPGELPPDPEAVFAALLREELRAAGMPAARMAREQALAANVAPWVIDFERRRRPGARLLTEAEGRMTFAAPAGEFTLTAKADRIEARGAVGDILDFKTGQAPSRRQVRSGVSPQLTLTGAILADGGFAEIGALTPGELLYVRVSGGRVPGTEEPRSDGDAAGLAARTLEGLKRRVARFDHPATPYLSWAMPQFIGRYGGDYDHLARLWEWHVLGDGWSEGGE